ncbi:MAG: glycosyltransferase involved in cell wall biosynthesis [Arenicella sp.]|jgi:glycosyltransferase involved in cell wall biosynthesis
MLKVIHLIPRNGIGGVETAVRSMIGYECSDYNFQLVLITGETLEAGDDGLSIEPLYSENNLFSHFRALKRVISAKPDVVVCSLWRSLPVSLCVKLIRPKTKLVFFLHSATTIHIFDRWLSIIMLSFCDACWADSEATLRARVGSRKRMRKRVVSFVIEPSPKMLKQSIHRPKFVFWGRLHQMKGLDKAINLIELLIASGCEANYEVWGPDGGAYSSLKHQIETHNLQQVVRLRGTAHHPDLTEIAMQNSFYLQLSNDEGMGMSVVEAMQRGLVPVVTPVGEIGSYCRAGENSIVVRDVDDFTDTVSEIFSLIKDESKYRQYQIAAHEYWNSKILYRDDFYKAVDELFL